jgi:hypothetical protein
MSVQPELEIDRRHPATQQQMRWLAPNPNLIGTARRIAREIYTTSLLLMGLLEDGPELTTGLRKLREAKDCFVIQSLEDGDDS